MVCFMVGRNTTHGGRARSSANCEVQSIYLKYFTKVSSCGGRKSQSTIDLAIAMVDQNKALILPHTTRISGRDTGCRRVVRWGSWIPTVDHASISDTAEAHVVTRLTDKDALEWNKTRSNTDLFLNLKLKTANERLREKLTF